MKDMFSINATEVRKEWSTIVDNVVREKPQFIKRTRDYMVLANMDLFEDVLSAYSFNAEKFIEDDGSVTLSLVEMDLVENAETEEQAKLSLAKSILEYSEEFYNEFQLWSKAPNRKQHVPYVLKALMLDNASTIGELIQCHSGKN